MKLPINYNETHFTIRKLVREEYVKLQNNKCYHCNELLTEPASKSVMKKSINTDLFPQGFFNYPVHLHHCHKTGMTIGAVHCHCNAVLWQYHGE